MLNPLRKGILASTLICSAAFSHSHKDIANTYTISAGKNYQSVLKSLHAKGVDVLGVDIRKSLIDINISNEELKDLKGLKLNLTKINTKSDKALDERYLNGSEVEALLKELASNYPEITKLEKIGESFEGRSIFAIKISDNPAIDEADEPSVLYNGMHHSREVMTAEVTTDIAKYLVENYKSDPKVKAWVDNNQIYVLPMLNVDGNAKVWQGDNMWRKNTRGGYGVDINRNYPTNWNACRGSSGWRGSQTYRGSAPASEPETNVLMDYVSKIKPVFNISYHAYSELIIYPYGCKGQRTANREVVEGIGKKMGEILDYVPGTAWETLYSVDGSDIDWMYQEEQVIPYVIEVSPRSDGFQPSYEKRDPTVKHNRAGWQYLLDRLEGPGLHGVSKDTKKIIAKRDGKVVSEYRVNPNGSFHIILTPGKYDVQFVGDKTINRSIEIGETKVNISL